MISLFTYIRELYFWLDAEQVYELRAIVKVVQVYPREAPYHFLRKIYELKREDGITPASDRSIHQFPVIYLSDIVLGKWYHLLRRGTGCDKEVFFNRLGALFKPYCTQYIKN